jgi:SAM-dependent methyltransferase
MSLERFLRWLRFNSWYFRNPPWDTGITPPELEEFIASHAAGRALDLGCGTGVNLKALARAGWKVVGVDFAFRAVAKARARLRQAGLQGEVIAGDVTDLAAISGSFDLILDIGCFHGVVDDRRPAYRANIRRLLNRGGTFLLYAHLREPAEKTIGIEEVEIQNLAGDFLLARRADSRDRWDRRAVWGWFEARD